MAKPKQKGRISLGHCCAHHGQLVDNVPLNVSAVDDVVKHIVTFTSQLQKPQLTYMNHCTEHYLICHHLMPAANLSHEHV